MVIPCARAAAAIGAGGKPGSGVAVGKHDDHLVIGRRSVKQPDCLGKRVTMVGVAAGRQCIDRVLQRVNRGNQLCVIRRRAGKADNADMVAGADLTVSRAAGRLGNDIDERVGASLHIGQRRTGHTAERSSTSAISVGLVIISGAAVSARVTRRVPSQSIRSTLTVLLELVMPIQNASIRGICSPIPVYVHAGVFDTLRHQTE